MHKSSTKECGVLLLLWLIVVSLDVCLCTSSSPSVPMIRSMDQLIANLGGSSITATKNSECSTIFDTVCPIGCNGRIGAEALVLDHCGICGGDGSTCPSDDDGSCGSTCIGLVVGIPLGILFLVILAAGVLFFTGVARRRRRRKQNTLPERNTAASTGQIANEHYSAPIHRLPASAAPTYGHQKRGSKVTMTKKKRTSKIRWTNGWGKGSKYN